MKLLAFTNEQEHMTVRSALMDGEPVFVAKDICQMLGIRNSRDAIGRLETEERVSVVVDTLGGKQEMTCTTESGMYALVFMSRKPAAKLFRRWVTNEVLPALREFGFYSLFPETEDAERLKLNARVAGQMKHIKISVESLREPVPEGYGTVSQHCEALDVHLRTNPGLRLRLINAVRALARARKVEIVYRWKPEGWRAVGYYPRDLVREALSATIEGFRPQPELF